MLCDARMFGLLGKSTFTRDRSQTKEVMVDIMVNKMRNMSDQR